MTAVGQRLATLAREVSGNFSTAMTAAGCGFELQWTALAVPAASKIYARVTLGGKYLLLSDRVLQTSQDKAWYRAYTGAAPGTPGAALSFTKTRADSTLASTLTGVYETTPNLTGATLVVVEPAFGGGAGQHATGGAASDNILRIYPPGVTFTLEVENAAAQPADMHVHLAWWEVSPSFLPPILDL